MTEHQAVRNGWPHDEHGNPYLRNHGEGRAMCTCGRLSPSGSASYRRHWIVAHRQVMLASGK